MRFHGIFQKTALNNVFVLQIWPLFKDCCVVAKKELKYAGPFGLALHLCGATFVDRATEKGRQAVNDAGKKAKANGTSLFLFPEGTRNRKGGGELLNFRKGAFHVALDAKMPILPIVVSEYEFLGPTRHDQFPGGDITIQVLPAIETDDFKKEDIDDLIKKTRDCMTVALNSCPKQN